MTTFVPPVSCRRDVPLATLTTLEVGGPARFVADDLTPEDAITLVTAADDAGVLVLPLGGGSNVLAADAGFPGVVVRLAGGPWSATQMGDQVELVVPAGTSWDTLVAQTVAEGWAGLECLSGIPGCVGAAPIQNIGAYGQEAADTLVAVEVWDRHRRERCWIPAAACGFGYRQSRFKSADAGRFLVLAVRLRLTIGGPPTLRYAELAQHLAGTTPGLAQVREAVLAIRRRKSMVYDPTDENHRSAGSFFLNPVVPAAVADVLSAADPSMPRWPAEGGIKLSAAWLIEHAGLSRGHGVGRVGLSTRHTLALVNRGGATAGEVWALADEVCQKVRASFGIGLEPEPVRVGW